jgi:hypothetical protein
MGVGTTGAIGVAIVSFSAGSLTGVVGMLMEDISTLLVVLLRVVVLRATGLTGERDGDLIGEPRPARLLGDRKPGICIGILVLRGDGRDCISRGITGFDMVNGGISELLSSMMRPVSPSTQHGAIVHHE